jgi:hypothetical protein
MPTLSATIGGGNNPVINVTALLGGANPTATLTIVGNGLLPAGSTMPFTVTNVTSNPLWLSVAPTTGTVGAAGTTLTITVDLTKLIGTQATVPGTLDGSFLVSSVNSTNTLTVSVILTTIHPPLFDGEVLNNNGSGFYTLIFPDAVKFAGTYAYFPNALAIYDTELGEELYFSTFDPSKGIYFYDLNTGDIWYTNPGLYPFFYDFNTNQWLQYQAGSGNGTKGSRKFYAWTYNFTTKQFDFTGLISK